MHWYLLKCFLRTVRVALFGHAKKHSQKQTGSVNVNEPSEIAGKVFLVGCAKYRGQTGRYLLLCADCTCWVHTLA